MKFTNTADVATKNICALIAGESGIGKTYLARTLPEKETLIVSAENGLLSLAGTNISVVEIESMDDMIQLLEQVKAGKLPFKYLYVDSLTEILDKYVATLKQRYTRKDTFVMWDDYLSRAVYIIKTLRDCNHTVFFTCLTKKVKDGLELVDQFDFSGQVLKDKIKSYFDEVIHYTMHEIEDRQDRVFYTDAQYSNLAKDRSGKLSPIEEPNLMNIINKIKGVQK